MDNQITVDQAYAAMFDFLEQVFRRTNADDLGALLGSMSTADDGLPADPAVAEEWRNSVAKARQGVVNTGLTL
jgi:hypothetical protein